MAPANRPGKLAWYDEVWIALPISLVAFGGAIGGGLGGGAWAINRKVFRATKNPAMRYVFTGLISGAAVIVWLVLAMTIFVALRRVRN
jgi:hypothetical protein